jgi:hypothetical protein
VKIQQDIVDLCVEIHPLSLQFACSLNHLMLFSLHIKPVLVHRETTARGAYPSTLNYHNFPKSVCTSVNEVGDLLPDLFDMGRIKEVRWCPFSSSCGFCFQVICHGIPDATVLEEGDLINIDVTVFLNGFHGDCSETFVVRLVLFADFSL